MQGPLKFSSENVIITKLPCAAVAQLDRVDGYEPFGREFKSSQPHQSEVAVHSAAFLFYPPLSACPHRSSEKWAGLLPIYFRLMFS